MRQYKDIEDMTKEELEEYLDDISSGYAFDPDNEILNSDKNLSVKELVSQLAADANSAQFKSMHEFAAIVSRASRISRKSRASSFFYSFRSMLRKTNFLRSLARFSCSPLRLKMP